MPTFKSILIVCICCFFAGISSAQDKFEYYKINRIKIAPLRVLYHPFEPGLELSYEHVFRPHWSFEVTGNRIFALITDSNFHSRKGWAFGSEIRYHFNSINFDHYYLSLGGAFAHSKTEATFYFRPSKDPTDTTVGFPDDSLKYKDAFTAYRNTSFITIRVGKILNLVPFHIEVSCGISIIYRDHWHVNRLHPDDYFWYNHYWRVNRRGLDRDVGWLFRIPMQLKICYSFGEKYANRRPEVGY
ncbi:MAG: hypothetical protein QE487_18895 [Fluviicola sp.]|nr:hypothetical protein [Fluviicola sp.]